MNGSATAGYLGSVLLLQLLTHNISVDLREVILTIDLLHLSLEQSSSHNN